MVSVAATLTVAVLGPSVMEPALPGAAGQPSWAFAAHPPAILAAGLAAVGLAAGALGLGLCLSALHRGWVVRPRPVLLAGLLAAAALALVPPFGSADHLSYAAYGRMVVSGRDPYTTTPAMLARFGDPVARAVQDWRGSPSVYGSLASGLQALASEAGGTSARLTVFVLSLLNVAAFAATGLLLYRLARGSPAGQLRAALLWACNPLLLQVLVAGAHVDSQAIVFAVAAITVFCLGLREGAATRAGPGSGSRREFAVCTAAGALTGLGAAVKLTMILVLAGLLMATVLPGLLAGGAGRPGRVVRARPAWIRAVWVRAVWVRAVWVRAGGLVTGFAAVAVVALVPWGPGALRAALPAGSMVSIGSPWRTVRLLLRLGAGEAAASHVVQAAAALLAVVLLVLLVSALARGGLVPRFGGDARLGPYAGLAVACAFAFTFAWLMAWPYVLPWYDSVGWALLALLPLPALGVAALEGAPGPPVMWRGRPVRLVVALDWLMLARTTALGFGYLPARGITMPTDLAWLRPVFRNAVTPLVLLITLLILLSLLRHPRRITDTDAPWSDTRVTG